MDEFATWLATCIREEMVASSMSLIWEEKIECDQREAVYREVLDRYLAWAQDGHSENEHNEKALRRGL